ncbi:GH116 family glycosyl-hydrolase [Alloacidobacterium sp.]|uniref:GH116 family glycosyl-hydrolase n=1 Tax=Alloacidobacterium sp. TaxID=2951999 RepID=UPI002D7434CE|nr:GH116 family glycosyl-hydrolase [Alloacidobacterium sp.]HYK37783.1 GH116 family glycosyl-hydrolase [Alloacidobacterium sp.]
MNKFRLDRRDFLKHAAGVVGAATQAGQWPTASASQNNEGSNDQREAHSVQEISYPRQFRGRQLKMISFPLGGVAAGSIGLGGRGQLCNWEIFNRPNKGFQPPYALPSIWVQGENQAPVARVLESRILPPYEGQDGLGSENAPGLSRLESAVFTGGYPFAHIQFQDKSLPVKVELQAFSPFIPHEPDDSGLPVAMLRYRASSLDGVGAKVSIAFSIDNPVKIEERRSDKRINAYRSGPEATGLYMSNPGLAMGDPMAGSFVLAALASSDTHISYWEGWPKGRWWNSPLLFWDQFSKSGELGTQPEPHDSVGVLCLQATIIPGKYVDFPFLLGWHFPNRTPEWCGWDAPPGEGKTIIGNYYATRFKDAWDAVEYAAKNIGSLEARTMMFSETFRNSTLPGEVKDAASANLSTLATTTCFRTSDGEFHGFEGSDDTHGCCFGNCTHVWNYETATTFLFPSFARSLRKSAFGYAMDDAGAIHFRQLLPDGKARSGFAAADGQMGQIIHAWLDWKLSGDDAWLRGIWPRVKKALEFAWVQGGWDGNRDGVLEGVQHNTYDVEFYGPNPMCGIYYLGALNACAEMAGAIRDSSSANEYQRLYEQGRNWIDANLFNGEYYVQKIRGIRRDEIAPHLTSDMGSENTETPEYQVGNGCLVDQLIGQYLAETGGSGPLVSEANIRATLQSIYRYNYKASLADHNNVQRTYALNDEAAVVICDYGKAERPRIPFPYYAEAWTGQEYALAALMIRWGMAAEALEIVRSARLRHDGEKRNPWDEPECGHHYVRAMSSWSAFVSSSGFIYDGTKAHVTALPRVPHERFSCFWSTGTGWGMFSYQPHASGTRFTLSILAGVLRCQSFEITGTGGIAAVNHNGQKLPNDIAKSGESAIVSLHETVNLRINDELWIEVRA